MLWLGDFMRIEAVGLIVTFLLGIFIFIGALIAFLVNKKEQITDFSLGLAFSVIIMLALVDLIPEVIEHLGLKYIWLFLIFVVLGYLLLRVLDHFVPDHHDHSRMTKKQANSNLAHIGVISSIALVIHNVVEGMAVYSTVLSSVSAGLMLTIGIGFHNLPLGMVIATTFYQGNQKPKKIWLMISGVSLSTFLGGFLAFLLNNRMLPEWVLGSLLSLTLGMLVFILCSELLPRIKESKFKLYRNLGLIVGVMIMIISVLI